MHPETIRPKTQDCLALLARQPLASIQDIACMKLDTISSRGSRKDFVDLYFILRQGFTLQTLMDWFDKKYSHVQYNKAHLIKSLTYFEDAEKETELKMLKLASWNEIKFYFQREIKKLI